MNTFGEFSLKNLSTVHPDMRSVLEEAIKTANFRVQEGHRGEDAQNAAYANKASKLRWPNSKHNTKPSLAADLVPWPFDFRNDWKDRARFARLAGHIEAAAARLGVAIRWGGDFDRDGKVDIDDEWKDFPHFELI